MDNDVRRQQFLKSMEPAIAEANRGAIHARLPTLDRETFLRFAVSVARARTHYLEEAIKFAGREQGGELSGAEVQRLGDLRQNYEEVLKAYEALSHALERGYLEVEEIT